MKRRSFLQSVVGVAGIIAFPFIEAKVDQVPVNKMDAITSIKKPKSENKILTPAEVTREALKVMESKLEWAANSDSLTTPVKKEDIYTISGFFETDPVTKLSTGKLKKFIAG